MFQYIWRSQKAYPECLKLLGLKPKLLMGMMLKNKLTQKRKPLQSVSISISVYNELHTVNVQNKNAPKVTVIHENEKYLKSRKIKVQTMYVCMYVCMYV